ncbi:MAG: hypothetical protein KA536_06540 [Saprospiraceae bacterium]|nr:hypothetical protein [Saprospiraceae bacterium]
MTIKHVLKYFAKVTIIPILYTYLSGSIILYFDNTPQVSKVFFDDYRTEKLFFTLCSFSYSLCTIPILLNINKNIANNSFLSFLTWFLLPTFLIILTFLKFGDFRKEIANCHFISICVIHLLILTINFISFKKDLKGMDRIHLIAK